VGGSSELERTSSADVGVSCLRLGTIRKPKGEKVTTGRGGISLAGAKSATGERVRSDVGYENRFEGASKPSFHGGERKKDMGFRRQERCSTT